MKNRVRFDYTYLYDDAGDRVQETTGGTTFYYLIDSNNLMGYPEPIEVKSGSPTNNPQYTYIIGNRILGQANNSGATYYFLVDAQDSTRVITVGSNGNVNQTINYDAFGNIINEGGGTIFLFNGDGEFDTHSGLVFHGSGRQSNSVTGTFVEMDDIFNYGSISNPVTENPYIYGDGDPENEDDPSGHYGLVGTLGAYGIGAGVEGNYGGLAADIFLQVSLLVATGTAAFETGLQEGLQYANQELGGGNEPDPNIDITPLPPGIGNGTDSDRLPMNALVVRGGTCMPEFFTKGAESVDANGILFGVSVNSAPNVDVATLCTTIPQKQVGVSTVGEVEALGGNVIAEPIPNNLFHCLLSGITAQVASTLFTPTILNPARL